MAVASAQTEHHLFGEQALGRFDRVKKTEREAERGLCRRTVGRARKDARHRVSESDCETAVGAAFVGLRDAVVPVWRRA